MDPNNPNSPLNRFKSANPLSLILVGIILVVLMVTAGYILSLLQYSGNDGQTYYKRNKNSQQKIIKTDEASQSAQVKEAGEWKTYTNSKYKLSFDYPPKYTIGNDSDYGVSLNGEDKIHVININFKSPQTAQANAKENQTFSDFAIQAAISDSQASGANGNSYFDKLTRQTPIQNKYGLTGYKLYFHWISNNFDNQGNPVIIDEAILKQPILSYDVSIQTNNALRAVEVLIAPPDNTTTNIDPSILDNIGNSIRFFQ